MDTRIKGRCVSIDPRDYNELSEIYIYFHREASVRWKDSSLHLYEEVAHTLSLLDLQRDQYNKTKSSQSTLIRYFSLH